MNRTTARALLLASVATATLSGVSAHADTLSMQITEYMYNGLGTGSIGEFVEFTNLSGSAIDMTGWSFDDNSRTAGSQSLSAFGSVAAGESVILTDDTAANFRTRWNLAGTVKVIGGNTNNLGRADEINLYNSSNALVDRMTYDDQTLGGTRTSGVSATVLFANLGLNLTASTVGAAVADSYGSIKNTTGAGEIANPGFYYSANGTSPVPVPAAAWLMVSGLGALGAMARRRRQA
jgi:hypothetical protein